MISDGIENCVSYIHNFNPEKSNNPFAYFTQIIYYAFLRRIQKEKKQLYIKHKSLERSVVFDQGEDFGQKAQNITSDYMNDFVENFERKEQKAKKKRQTAKGVERFYQEFTMPKEDFHIPAQVVNWVQEVRNTNVPVWIRDNYAMRLEEVSALIEKEIKKFNKDKIKLERRKRK